MEFVGLEGLESLKNYMFFNGSGVVFGFILVPKMMKNNEHSLPEPSGTLLGASWDPLG